MDFSQPLWLLGGLIVTIGLILVYRRLGRKRQAALTQFVAPQLLGRLTGNISTTRRRIKKLLVISAVVLCFIALARPQYGYQWVEVKRKGIDVLFALDTSKSMLAEDIKPNRLQRASLAIRDFVEKQDGDRLGLLPFAGSAYLMCPLTIDYDAFLHSLAAVNTRLIPQGGTNIGAVIEKAVQVLNNGANHKILIILTDGENLQGDAVHAAEEAALQGLTIFTVGVGTDQGELIPVASSSGPGFVKDSSGNFVTSRLDAKTLSLIAEKTSGLYVPLGTAGEGLETIYQKKLALIPKEELAERRHKLPVGRSEWPLALAGILLILDMLVGERRSALNLPLLSTGSSLLGRFKWRKTRNLCLAVLFLALLSGEGHASEGEDAYNRGDYLAAYQYYRKQLEKKPDDPELLYNLGTAAYKNILYDDAIAAFSGALKSDKLNTQQKAYYNRGNSYYRKGAQMVQTDASAAAGHWRQALNSMNSALELDPADADAQHNRNLIEKQLEELEKQLEKDRQEKDTNQDDRQKPRDSDSQDKGEKNQQEDPSGQQGAEPEDKQQSPQDGREEQGTSGDRSEKNGEQQADAEAAGKEDDKAAQQAARDAVRQQLGKMTREEAERLLNGLKNEEGNLNFVPSGRRAQEQENDKDW